MKTMSTHTDDELQRMAEEAGSMDSNSRELNSPNRDLMAYRKLFSILGEQPEHKPTGIEAVVIAKIEHSRKRSVILDHVWLGVGVFFLVVIGIVAVVVSTVRISFSGWQLEIMALGVCAGVVIAVLNTIERKLLRR